MARPREMNVYYGEMVEARRCQTGRADRLHHRLKLARQAERAPGRQDRQLNRHKSRHEVRRGHLVDVPAPRLGKEAQ